MRWGDDGTGYTFGTGDCILLISILLMRLRCFSKKRLLTT